jgi:ribonuclease P protein component
LIVRVRQRQTFQRLTREGVRIRRSNLWCTWCPQSDSTPATGPAVAFAIGRAVGPATTRNRLRRRLRAILAELDSVEPLPAITMLIGATPAAAKLTFDRLRTELEQLLNHIRSATLPPGS